jgi:hypothetical protein
MITFVELVAQWVRTSYTKRSRGGQAATRRNGVPIAFRLPTDGTPIVHEVMMHESDDFAVHEEVHPRPPSSSDVEVRLVDGRLRVRLLPSVWGMPRRHRRPPAVFLHPGEWIRWQTNYRFVDTCTGEWSYRSDALNLSHGPVHPDTFLGLPTRLVDERTRLR